MFMETSALDSTNVENAFLEVLTGCPATLDFYSFQFTSSIILFFHFAFYSSTSPSSTASHPAEGGQQTGDARLHQRRHSVQPHHAHRTPGEEPQLLQEFLTANGSSGGVKVLLDWHPVQADGEIPTDKKAMFRFLLLFFYLIFFTLDVWDCVELKALVGGLVLHCYCLTSKPLKTINTSQFERLKPLFCFFLANF